MENPGEDVRQMLYECASARSADDQVVALHRYFTPNAEFAHPLCYIPGAERSRESIVLIHLLYQALFPRTEFYIKRTSFFSELSGRLDIDLVFKPYLRGIGTQLGWAPAITFHIHFWLVTDTEYRRRKNKTVWLIHRQEDLFHPLRLFEFWPLRSVGSLIYCLSRCFVLLAATILIIFFDWVPDYDSIADREAIEQLSGQFEQSEQSPNIRGRADAGSSRPSQNSAQKRAMGIDRSRTLPPVIEEDENSHHSEGTYQERASKRTRGTDNSNILWSSIEETKIIDEYPESSDELAHNAELETPDPEAEVYDSVPEENEAIASSSRESEQEGFAGPPTYSANSGRSTAIATPRSILKRRLQ